MGGPCSSGQLQQLGIEHRILHPRGVSIEQQPNATGKAPLGQDVALYFSKHQATGGLQLPLRSKGRETCGDQISVDEGLSIGKLAQVVEGKGGFASPVGAGDDAADWGFQGGLIFLSSPC